MLSLTEDPQREMEAVAFFWPHGSSSLGPRVPVVSTEYSSEALALVGWPQSPGWLSSWPPIPVSC